LPALPLGIQVERHIPAPVAGLLATTDATVAEEANEQTDGAPDAAQQQRGLLNLRHAAEANLRAMADRQDPWPVGPMDLFLASEGR
jgi:hypothetical protein